MLPCVRQLMRAALLLSSEVCRVLPARPMCMNASASHFLHTDYTIAHSCASTLRLKQPRVCVCRTVNTTAHSCASALVLKQPRAYVPHSQHDCALLRLCSRAKATQGVCAAQDKRRRQQGPQLQGLGPATFGGLRCTAEILLSDFIDRTACAAAAPAQCLGSVCTGALGHRQHVGTRLCLVSMLCLATLVGCTRGCYASKPLKTGTTRAGHLHGLYMCVPLMSSVHCPRPAPRSFIEKQIGMFTYTGAPLAYESTPTSGWSSWVRLSAGHRLNWPSCLPLAVLLDSFRQSAVPCERPCQRACHCSIRGHANAA